MGGAKRYPSPHAPALMGIASLHPSYALDQRAFVKPSCGMLKRLCPPKRSCCSGKERGTPAARAPADPPSRQRDRHTFYKQPRENPKTKGGMLGRSAAGVVQTRGDSDGNSSKARS